LQQIVKFPVKFVNRDSDERQIIGPQRQRAGESIIVNRNAAGATLAVQGVAHLGKKGGRHYEESTHHVDKRSCQPAPGAG
jgi:hypothetical protein